ncbi:hypothetical protein [Robiginitalea sp. IMCC43444]|uniref:hypothetical protein n=1 Tax=Robiginitalea sp. IMCC43444 TaxID=3459121 RepID=UPI004040F16C
MFNKLFKIFGWTALTILLLSLATYLIFNEQLPEGEPSQKADTLARRMLKAVNHEAYRNTRFLEWTFSGVHHYRWDKTKGTVAVEWGENKVLLHLNQPGASEVYIAGELKEGSERTELVEKATDYFNNDSFWLVAPHKVFDPGTERRLVRLENGEEGLMVTYTSGGSTPGDSYLWLLDENGLPRAFKMWVGILPIGGIEASWDDWLTTESGTLLPRSHKVWFVEIEMGNVRGWNSR